MCSVTNSTTPVMATNLQSKANGNIRMTTMPPSEPPLSQSQNTDSQNGQVPSSTSSQQANGNSVTCSAPNGHNSMSNSQYTSCDCTGGPPVSYQFHIPNQYIMVHYLFLLDTKQFSLIYWQYCARMRACVFACVVNNCFSFLLPKYSFNTQTRIDAWFFVFFQ